MVAFQISPKIESLYGLDRPQNYKSLYGILQHLQGCHLNSFPMKTLKLGWVAFHSLTFQLKCLDFQCNQYKKLTPVLSRFCNWPWKLPHSSILYELLSLIYRGKPSEMSQA